MLLKSITTDRDGYIYALFADGNHHLVIGSGRTLAEAIESARKIARGGDCNLFLVVYKHTQIQQQ